MKERTTICPRCGIRPRRPERSYCIECEREVAKIYYDRRRKRIEDVKTAENAPTAPEKSTAAIASALYDKMLAECRRRGYDPDLMIGIARALPMVAFVKSPGGYVHPVWRGKIIGKNRKHQADKEGK